MRYIGLDVHRDWCDVAIYEDANVRSCEHAWAQQLAAEHVDLTVPWQPLAWLTTTAMREAWRLNGVEQRSNPVDDSTLDMLSVSRGRAASSAAELAELHARLNVVDELPERPRRFLLRLAIGYSYDEIAAAVSGCRLQLDPRALRFRRRIRSSAIGGSAPLRVDDVVGERCPGGWRLSAAVHSACAADGERLHFTVRGAAPQWLPVLGDAFLAALLMPAMAVGEDLVVDAPVSPRLRRSARTVMDVYRAWWGERYGSISLACPTTRSFAGGDAPATALYFTAGVDSFYSLLKDVELSDDPAHESVTHLLYANFEAHEGVAYDRLLDRLRRVAGETDRQLLVIDTNVRTLADRVAYWPHYHGAALASVALALQGLLGRCLIAASDAYWDLPPWGSHPILDHLWSTESLDVVHDGAEASRTDKVERQIARSRLALDTLDVCWRSEPAHNCGVCEKCLRTMTTLELADSLSACATLPHTLDLDVLRNARLAAEGQRDAMRCLATDAANRGRTDIVDAIEDCLRRNHPCGGWSEDLASDNPRGCTVQASTTDGDVRAFGAPIP